MVDLEARGMSGYNMLAITCSILVDAFFGILFLALILRFFSQKGWLLSWQPTWTSIHNKRHG